MWTDVVNLAILETFVLSTLKFSDTATEFVSLKTYFVEDWNDKVLKMYEKGVHDVRLKLSRTGAGGANYEMSVVTSEGHLLAIRILNLNMGTCSAKLSLYNVEAIPSQSIALELCQNYEAEYLTHSPRMVVKFQSLLFMGSVNNNFDMLITSYKSLNDSSCDSGYFDCTNNRCIKEDLVCNTRDNCGNGLDEDQSCSSTWSNAVLITLAILCLAVVISIYLYKSKRCSKDRVQRATRTVTRRINVRPVREVGPQPPESSTRHHSQPQHQSSCPVEQEPPYTVPNVPLPAVLQDSVGGSIAPGYTAHPSPGAMSANPQYPQHSPGFGQPSSYQEPPPVYQEPPPVYQEPRPVYQDPPAGYQDPSGYQYQGLTPDAAGYQREYQDSGLSYGQPQPSAPPPPSEYIPTADNPPYYQSPGY